MALPQRRADDADTIYKVETVPPPDGEDAYSAPTKVGPLSGAQLAALMAKAEDEPPPASAVQPRRSKVTPEAVALEIDSRDLHLMFAAVPVVVEPTAPPPAAVLTAAITPPEPARRNRAVVFAVAIAALAIHAAGGWMLARVLLQH